MKSWLLFQEDILKEMAIRHSGRYLNGSKKRIKPEDPIKKCKTKQNKKTVSI